MRAVAVNAYGEAPSLMEVAVSHAVLARAGRPVLIAPSADAGPAAPRARSER